MIKQFDMRLLRSLYPYLTNSTLGPSAEAAATKVIPAALVGAWETDEKDLSDIAHNIYAKTVTPFHVPASSKMLSAQNLDYMARLTEGGSKGQSYMYRCFSDNNPDISGARRTGLGGYAKSDASYSGWRVDSVEAHAKANRKNAAILGKSRMKIEAIFAKMMTPDPKYRELDSGKGFQKFSPAMAIGANMQLNHSFSQFTKPESLRNICRGDLPDTILGLWHSRGNLGNSSVEPIGGAIPELIKSVMYDRFTVLTTVSEGNIPPEFSFLGDYPSHTAYTTQLNSRKIHDDAPDRALVNLWGDSSGYGMNVRRLAALNEAMLIIFMLPAILLRVLSGPYRTLGSITIPASYPGGYGAPLRDSRSSSSEEELRSKIRNRYYTMQILKGIYTPSSASYNMRSREFILKNPLVVNDTLNCDYGNKLANIVYNYRKKSFLEDCLESLLYSRTSSTDIHESNRERTEAVIIAGGHRRLSSGTGTDATKYSLEAYIGEYLIHDNYALGDQLDKVEYSFSKKTEGLPAYYRETKKVCLENMALEKPVKLASVYAWDTVMAASARSLQFFDAVATIVSPYLTNEHVGAVHDVHNIVKKMIFDIKEAFK